ncbi:MAG: IS5 family transposase [Kiritimatiellae bacterium]|nr:IS5 family transposase [Kiritimatiellia bacterium]
MYKAEKSVQMTFEDFNQSYGMKLNVKDEWIVVANSINWAAVEEKYMEFFPSKRGRPALNARMALGALIIQHKAKLSDRNLVKEVARNPYYQYFLGLERFQTKCPSGHGVLPELRKRFGMGFINEINEVVIRNAKPTPEHADDRDEKPSANGNLGTMILDATCPPSNIRFPQDSSLLDEAREKLDGMIDKLHAMVEEPRRPRTYRKVLRKAYLAMAKAKKRPAKKMRSLVRVMLCAVKRNMAFVDDYLAKGLILADKRDVWNLDAIRRLYAQQKEMFDEKKHRGADRIVSIAQPFVRPIVRGKAKTPVEFGAKYDVSVDENGYARLEKASFDAYNECTVLKGAVEGYRERTGRYPKRVLVDQVYRTKENRAYCEERGIEMSGRKSGRPPEDEKRRRKAERAERKNDVDRIEVERFFSRDKRCFGAGLIMTKLSNTTLGSIALSVLVANLFGAGLPFFVFYIVDAPEGCASFDLVEVEDDAA